MSAEQGPNPSLARRLATAGFVLVTLGFVGATVASNWEQVQAHRWSIDWMRLVLSTLALVAVLSFAVAVWRRVLIRFVTGQAGWSVLARIWFLSSIGRYTPGKIWQFVAAAALAKRAGLAPVVVLTSLVVYMGFGLLSAGVMSAATLPLSVLGIDVPAWMTLAVSGAAALGLCHPAVINGALRLVPRAVHREVLVWEGSWADGIVVVSAALVYWGLYGVAFYLFLDAVVGVPYEAIPVLAGINALSFLVGYLFFIAPAGLGARELIITVLLASVVGGAGLAGAVAVLSRLWV
ncbi:MAG: hypothetical protein OEM96_04765, partial [Gemmatimonadota bacterium]|nr:hypothetical protein [Gemmatimonadota bacterium]